MWCLRWYFMWFWLNMDILTKLDKKRSVLYYKNSKWKLHELALFSTRFEISSFRSVLGSRNSWKTVGQVAHSRVILTFSKSVHWHFIYHRCFFVVVFWRCFFGLIYFWNDLFLRTYYINELENYYTFFAGNSCPLLLLKEFIRA